jgi:hypothetical protein
MTYFCSICGKEHDALLRDMAYHRPGDYFDIPPEECSQRVWFDSKANPDLCVIDGSRFYLRGVLSMPIRGEGDEFRWGTWARVEEQDFRRYYELWDETDVSDEPVFRGYLSGGIRDFADSDGLEVEIELQSNNQRPRLTVVVETHPLAIAQRDGVTMEDVHAFVLPTPA